MASVASRRRPCSRGADERAEQPADRDGRLHQADHRGRGAVLAQRERDRERHAGEGEVHQRRDEHHRPQDGHLPDEPQAVGHLAPQRLALDRPLRTEPPRGSGSPCRTRPRRRRRRPGTGPPGRARTAPRRAPGRPGWRRRSGPRWRPTPPRAGRPPRSRAARRWPPGRRWRPRPPRSRSRPARPARTRDAPRPGRASTASRTVRMTSQTIIVSRRSNRSDSAPAGSCRHEQRDRPGRPDHPGQHRRMGQREDEQRIGEQPDLAAGIGQQLADPQHPETSVTPERNLTGNVCGRLGPAGVHRPNTTHAALGLKSRKGAALPRGSGRRGSRRRRSRERRPPVRPQALAAAKSS